MLSAERKRITTSIRLDSELHKALRQIAFNRRTSLHCLLLEGARLVHHKHQQELNGREDRAPSATVHRLQTSNARAD